jgi:RNA polymerase sigma factor (sigma-70 family)
MHELDDHTLLRQFAEQNSEAAFAALVARHVDKVYSTALRQTRNAHAAEEITQAVFVILAKKSGRLGGKVILAGWLYETARLTAVTFIRSEIRRARREQEAHMQTTLNGGGDASSPFTSETVWPHIAPLLDDALAGLSAADRHAVVLRYFDGKSLGEVGTALGASEDAAKKRVTRAVEKLRGWFTKRGVTLTATVLTAAISANSVQAAPLGLAATVTATAAKGAAVSGSTLTLIKGALKIMAWTKIKTAVAAGVGLLLASGTTLTIIKEMRNSRSTPRTTPATKSIKGQLVGLAQLVDAGNTTPEAAWESRYWARAKGDYDAIITATEPQAVQTAKAWMGDKSTFRARSQAEFASFAGIQILARKNMASDRVELKYQFAFTNTPTQPETKIVTMVKANGVWRCAQTRAYDTSWDNGSQPEPQP